MQGPRHSKEAGGPEVVVGRERRGLSGSLRYICLHSQGEDSCGHSPWASPPPLEGECVPGLVSGRSREERESEIPGPARSSRRSHVPTQLGPLLLMENRHFL